MESLMCAIGSFLLGTVGWFAVGFFGKPLLDFLNLRSQVHEEIILPWHATNVIASLPLRWYLVQNRIRPCQGGRRFNWAVQLYG
jgi:hypothetical protein